MLRLAKMRVKICARRVLFTRDLAWAIAVSLFSDSKGCSKRPVNEAAKYQRYFHPSPKVCRGFVDVTVELTWWAWLEMLGVNCGGVGYSGILSLFGVR